MTTAHAFIVSPAIATSKALADSQPVYRRSGRVWLDESAARRWLDEHGWVTGSGRPAEVYTVELASGFAESTAMHDDGVPRLCTPAIVRPCEDAERWHLLSHPDVVEAALEVAQGAGMAYADGRRAAVALLSRLRPATPQDLASMLRMSAAAGLLPGDIDNA